MTEERVTYHAGDAPGDHPVVMTVDQVADYLQIGRRTVYNMVAAGELPGAKVGEQWRFFRPEIDRWLTRLSRENIGDPTPVDQVAGEGAKVYNGAV